MTQKQIDSLLANSRVQRDRAQRMIHEHFDDLEAKNQASYWVNLFLVHKAQVEWLEKQKPDDE